MPKVYLWRCFKARVKRVVKYLMLGLLVLSVVPAPQSVVFSRNAANGIDGPRADLIAVFPGAPERIAAGVRLAAEGRAANLLVACREPTASLGELGYYSVTGKLLGDWPMVQKARAWKIRPA